MNSTTLPWLSDEEVDSLCEGLVNDAAKVRYLRRQGLTVTRKPNGRPLLMRDHTKAVLSGMKEAQAATETIAPTRRQPNRDALILQFAGRGA